MKRSASVETAFPDLVSDGYEVTSCENQSYNCIAWAAGVNGGWWDPAPGYTWPDGAPREYTVEALIEAYRSLGFEICQGAHKEGGCDKIAVYGDQDGWTHAARQLETGKWTSKLGRSEDIEHTTPEGLTNSEYGNIICIMKRVRT